MEHEIWCPLIQDENFKRLIDELGHAINDSLSDSARVSEVMEQIRAAGYDLFLVLEVTIGFNRRDEAALQLSADGDSSSSSKPGKKAISSDFHLTNQDAQFLRALKITVEEEKR